MNKLENITILYVEDDEITRENISEFLGRKCHKLFVAKDGLEGYEKFKECNPNIVITDIEMPNLNGIELATKIRKESSTTQIIIATAFTDPEYLLKAVNLHLVKYIIKPLSILKINEALQECEKYIDDSQTSKKQITKELFYDLFTKEAVLKNEIVQLSKSERNLIELLIKNYPAATSYESIEQNVYEFATSKNAIKLLIKSLRTKIGKDTITNVSGFGYNINIEKED